MQISDIIKGDKCSRLFSEADKFSNDMLNRYNDDLEKNEFYFQDKDIFDLVWGTIELNAAEICILDSPILQRLRRIQQLGLANTVYCNATHSRFSHTLGVLEVSSRMARVVSKKMKEVSGDFNFCEIVRFAALFHDVGHMFYSHVSELFFTYDTSFPLHTQISAAKSYFCNSTSSTSSLHEILSVMIVNSTQVRRLFNILSRQNVLSSKISKQENMDQFIEYVSSLIIGIPIDKSILPYSMIINSAIDADKLDYLFRDSECTKVPIAIDIARIVQKLDIVVCKKVPRSPIWNDSTYDSVPAYIMAIKNSAKKVFWQLSSARSMMFESVYYHHKILTAETMFRKFIGEIFVGISAELISFSKLLKLTDDAFGEHFNSCLLHSGPINDSKQHEAKIILSNIIYRNLYKRVATFSQDTLVSDSIAPVKIFIDSIIKNHNSGKAIEFKSKLSKEYSLICDLINKPINKKPDFMFIEMKYQEMDSMPVEMGDGLFVWSSNLMKQETMESGRKSKQEQYFLITDCVDREIVFLALEKVLLQYEIKGLSKEASICAKFTTVQLNKLRRKLLDLQYYDKALFLLPDEMFSQLYDLQLFEMVVAKYQSYSGVNNCKVTQRTLFEFLRQFLHLNRTKEEISNIIDGTLKILNQGLFIDREFFAKNVEILLTDLKKTRQSKDYITLLGNQFDSAKHLSYYFNDIEARRDFLFTDNISIALPNVNAEDRIIFFDDGAYSGKQVVSIFQEYCGIPVDERATNEHHVNQLNADELSILKSTNIVLSYLCFNSKSETYIIQALSQMGFDNVTIMHRYDLSAKIFDDNSFGIDKESIQLIKDAFEEIGRKILMARCYITDEKRFKDRWDEKRINESTLGYNDAQQMVVFDSNIPTYSLCVFWTRPQDDESIWCGIFKRTLKD